MARARRPVAPAVGAEPLVRLPEDALAVEWWLARRAIEAGGEMPYADDGVLALWPEHVGETGRWTFGLEFEFAAADAQWVASELYARGLAAAAETAEYHTDRIRGFWTVEQDRTVTSVFESGDGSPPIVVGGEVVSPPLRDTPETWRQVAVVLEVLRACGAEVNQSCGLHVHIGVDAFREPLRHHDGGDPALRSPHEPERDAMPALSRLAVLASVCFEDLIFRLASAEGGRHRGRAFFYRHCRPLQRPLQERYETLSQLTEDLGTEGVARRAALNLTNVGDPIKDTVEFRQCNGTLDPRIVQAFCRLCAALVGAARWQPEVVALTPEPLGSHWTRQTASRSRFGDQPTGSWADASTRALASAATDERDQISLWRFLGAAFPHGLPAEAAASLLWLFRRGTWQPSLAALAAGER